MKNKTVRVESLTRSTLHSISDEDLAAVSGGVSLTHGHIKWTYTPQRPDGSGVTATYDLVQAKSV